MDDGVLACGGTIAMLQNKEQIHIIYATDGMASPAPALPWHGSVSEELGKARINEAKNAMGVLGVPEENIHFLGFPDGRLKNYFKDLNKSLIKLFEQLGPKHIFVPFRYDQHTDHLALNHAVTDLLEKKEFMAQQHEYFVYYRYRFLPQRDLRKYIIPKYLYAIDIKEVSERKRGALDCFKSQTTAYFAWQTRPNLSSWLLDEVSQTPEVFFRCDFLLPNAAIFKNSATWIRLAHILEPIIKKKKDQFLAIFQRRLSLID
jgi:LmbE family N-acetylglucosaminyl deacetylase